MGYMKRANVDVVMVIFLLLTLGGLIWFWVWLDSQPPIPRPADRRVYTETTVIDLANLPSATSSDCDAGIMTDRAADLIEHLGHVGRQCNWYLYSPNGTSIKIYITEVNIPTTQPAKETEA